MKSPATITYGDLVRLIEQGGSRAETPNAAIDVADKNQRPNTNGPLLESDQCANRPLRNQRHGHSPDSCAGRQASRPDAGHAVSDRPRRARRRQQLPLRFAQQERLQQRRRQRQRRIGPQRLAILRAVVVHHGALRRLVSLHDAATGRGRRGNGFRPQPRSPHRPGRRRHQVPRRRRSRRGGR